MILHSTESKVNKNLARFRVFTQSDVLRTYASARRFFARLASETFLSSLQDTVSQQGARAWRAAFKSNDQTWEIAKIDGLPLQQPMQGRELLAIVTERKASSNDETEP
jgi:hypothetical protein